MNEHNQKKIVFNKSTLWSLKAELLKKQEEVLAKKQLPQNKIENFKPPKPKPNDNHVGKDTPSFRDNLKAVDVEELEACRKAKAALEKKAELYEHLSDSVGQSQLAGRFLVDFNTKKQKENETATSSSVREPTPPRQSTPPLEEDDDSEWTEFTDCLGRTRKCLKTDLDLYMKKDMDLMRVLNKDKEPAETDRTASNEDDPQTEKPFLVQKTNDYLKTLREKWEQKEKELLSKDKDIHYQDLLFDEARMHGVAYYSFSTDEAERQKQMEELKRLRAETLRSQEEAAAARQRREDAVKARVAAARARIRARAGLPPEEPKDNEKDFTACLMEFLTKQRDEADTKAKEEEQRKREEQERERQKLREAYVREWDLGKEGVEDKLQRFRELTQEEYVEQQRAKRIDEFAPPTTSTKQVSAYYFDDKGTKIQPATKTWSEVRSEQRLSKSSTSELPEPEEKGLYFSTTKNKNKSNMKYKNFVRAPNLYEPILNEVGNDEGPETPKSKVGKTEPEPDIECPPPPKIGKYMECPPPPTFEYYGPSTKQRKSKKPFDSDVVEAYAQGVKSLETKSRQPKLRDQYDFTFE